MFSEGQVVFAVLFTILFTVVIIRMYRRDRKLHRRNYKGVYWVGIAFFVFLILLFAIKYLLRE